MKVVFIDDSIYSMKLLFDGDDNSKSKDLLQRLVKEGHSFEIIFFGNAEKPYADDKLPDESAINQFLDDFADELSFAGFKLKNNNECCEFEWPDTKNTIVLDNIVQEIKGDYSKILTKWDEVYSDISSFYGELTEIIGDANIILIDIKLISGDDERLTQENNSIPLLAIKIAEALQRDNKKYLFYSSFQEIVDFSNGFDKMLSNIEVGILYPKLYNRFEQLTVEEIDKAITNIMESENDKF